MKRFSFLLLFAGCISLAGCASSQPYSAYQVQGQQYYAQAHAPLAAPTYSNQYAPAPSTVVPYNPTASPTPVPLPSQSTAPVTVAPIPSAGTTTTARPPYTSYYAPAQGGTMHSAPNLANPNGTVSGHYHYQPAQSGY